MARELGAARGELQAGNASEAREPLAALLGKLGDPALEKLLEGRVLLLEGKYPEALEAFAKSAELDGRRTDALLLAGAAAARAKNERQGLRVRPAAGASW